MDRYLSRGLEPRLLYLKLLAPFRWLLKRLSWTAVPGIAIIQVIRDREIPSVDMISSLT